MKKKMACRQTVAVIRNDLRGNTSVPVGNIHYQGDDALPCRWVKRVSKKEAKEYDASDTYGWMQVYYEGKWRCCMEIDWDTFRIRR